MQPAPHHPDDPPTSPLSSPPVPEPAGADSSPTPMLTVDALPQATLPATRRLADDDQTRALLVLLVDDHPEMREQLRRLLQEEHMVVVAEAGNGRTALEAVHAVRPDVAVVDVRMPVMDELEFTRRLTSDHPGIRVVVHTADASRTVRTLAERAGAAAVTLKGDPVDRLLDAIRPDTPEGPAA